MNTAQSILEVVCYFDVFNYPVNEAQLWQFSSHHVGSFLNFRKILEKLTTSKKLIQRGDYFALPNRSIIIKTRFANEAYSTVKMRKAKKIAHYIGYIPTIELVGISGSLSMLNAAVEDDIDLFIITKSGTLWLTRFFLTLLLDLFHLRRRPGKREVSDKICTNMFVSLESMQQPKSERNLYIAHEIVQMKPLLDKHDTYQRFLYENIWIKRYLPHTNVPTVEKRKERFTWIFQPFERLFFAVQVHMMRKRSKEVIELTRVRFHPRDARPWVLREYQKRCEQNGI